MFYTPWCRIPASCFDRCERGYQHALYHSVDICISSVAPQDFLKSGVKLSPQFSVSDPLGISVIHLAFGNSLLAINQPLTEKYKILLRFVDKREHLLM